MPNTGSSQQQIIAKAAGRYGVPPRLLYGIYGAETNFGKNVRTSTAGAVGPFQFEPGTAKSLGIDPYDFASAANGAAKYLKQLRQESGSWHEAVGKYNAGPGGNLSNPETAAYVPKVFQLSKGYGGGSTPASTGSTGNYTTTTIPGQDNSGTRRQLLAQYLLNEHAPEALPNLVTALRNARDVAPSTTTTRSAASAVPKSPGVASFGNQKVASWIAPILNYARQHGWTGSVTSGYRSYADQQRIYNSGVRPAAKPGTSNHEFTAYPGGAVDVSNAAQLAAILKRSPYASKLVWAGSKDPVHFSHPHGGGY